MHWGPLLRPRSWAARHKVLFSSYCPAGSREAGQALCTREELWAWLCRPLEHPLHSSRRVGQCEERCQLLTRMSSRAGDAAPRWKRACPTWLRPRVWAPALKLKQNKQQRKPEEIVVGARSVAQWQNVCPACTRPGFNPKTAWVFIQTQNTLQKSPNRLLRIEQNIYFHGAELSRKKGTVTAHLNSVLFYQKTDKIHRTTKTNVSVLGLTAGNETEQMNWLKGQSWKNISYCWAQSREENCINMQTRKE